MSSSDRKRQPYDRRGEAGGAWLSRQPLAGGAAGEADRFALVEKEAGALRRQRAAGRITDQELEARLEELMVQDSSGGWWVAGVEPGQWYHQQDGRWISARPPGFAAPHRPRRFGEGRRIPAAQRHMEPLKGIACLVLGLPVAWLLAYALAAYGQSSGSLAAEWYIPVLASVGVLGSLAVGVAAIAVWRRW